MAKVDQKTVLIVIDGWGIATEQSRKDGDAILAADTPTMDELFWVVPDKQEAVVGVIGLSHVQFRGCQMMQIGLAVPEAQLEAARAAFEVRRDPQP